MCPIAAGAAGAAGAGGGHNGAFVASGGGWGAPTTVTSTGLFLYQYTPSWFDARIQGCEATAAAGGGGSGAFDSTGCGCGCGGGGRWATSVSRVAGAAGAAGAGGGHNGVLSHRVEAGERQLL